MGIRNTEAEKRVALFDSVTDTAFGPIFDSGIEADSFVEFAEDRGIDVRTLNDDEIQNLFSEWMEDEREKADSE